MSCDGLHSAKASSPDKFSSVTPRVCHCHGRSRRNRTCSSEKTFEELLFETPPSRNLTVSGTMLALGTLLYVPLLLINAMAVLSEDRFLAKSENNHC